MFNRLPKGSLLLAGLAAYAYYKYSKMTPEQKRDITDKLKGQAKKVYDQFVPQNVKDQFTNVKDQYTKTVNTY